MKKFKFLLLVLLMLVVLTSCKSNKTDGDESKTEPPVAETMVTPIYQGVTFETAEAYALKAKKEKNDKFEDEKIKDVIKQDFGVLTTEELSYYTIKGEKAYITLNFYNPSQFEILSFVLNGVKYQTFQFTEDSTAEAITVGITIPNESGIFEYYIEQVKYIDGDEIKDCKMEGNQSIKIGIGYDIAPDTVTDFEASYDELTVNSTIIDTSNVVSDSDGEFKIYIFDEHGLVDSMPVRVGKNNMHFKNLEINKNYTYVIAASLDFYDGNGKHVEILEQGDFKTKNCFDIYEAKIDKHSIKFDINKHLDDVEIDEVNLYHNDNLIETKKDLNLDFADLYSNTKYKVVIKYHYNEKDYSCEYEYETLPLEIPSVGLEVSADKKTVNYQVNNTDNDEILTINKVEILKDGNVVTSSNTLEGSFESLLSNTKYEVKVTYSYNLNDGKTDIVETISKEITTKALTLPTFGFNYDLSLEEVSGSLIINDLDEVSKVVSVDLLRSADNALISTTKEVDEFSFAVHPNTKYQLVINYKYDLNDGNGTQTGKYTLDFSSYKSAPTFSFVELSLTDTTMEFDFDIKDLSAVGSISNIYLYQGSELMKKVPTTDYQLTDLNSNTTYKLVAEYVYDLDNGLGSQKLTEEYEFTTLKTKPKLVIENSVITETSIKVNPTITDTNSCGKLEKIELYLNNELLSSLTEGYVFEGLLSNTRYEVKCYYTYDINLGSETLVVSKEIMTNAKEAPTVDVQLEANKNSITYKVLNDSAEITKVELLRNGALISTLNEVEGLFEGLLSNNEYSVKVSYTYDLNEGNGLSSSYITKTIKTKALVAPTVGVKNSILSDTNITGMVVVSDIDKTYTLTSINLYQNDILLSTTNESNYSFQVAANTTYKLVVEYAYNLGDGNGEVNATYEVELTSARQVPTIDVVVENYNDTTATFDVLVNDINGVGSISNIYLYKGSELISKVNSTNYELTNLISNTTYKLVVEYIYDLSNGLGSQKITDEVEFTTLKTKPSLVIENSVITETSIKVNPTITDTNSCGKLEKIELYLNNELVSSLTEGYLFENLLSNTRYEVKCYYTYDINLGSETLVVSKEIMTNAKEAPTVDIQLEANKNSITYKVLNDSAKITKVELLRNGALISTLNEVEGLFDGLLSNNTYTVKVSYTYDLNEGNGLSSSYISKEITTKALTAPVVGVENSEVTDKLISGNLVINDIDKIFNLHGISLYQNGYLVSTVSGGMNYQFAVMPNTTYQLVVEYSYNLNDGNEEITSSYSTNLTSSKEIPTIYMNAYHISQTEVYYDLYINDNNSVGHVKSMRLYENGQYVRDLSQYDYALYSLNTNTAYKVSLIYVYDLNDGKGSQELVYDYEFMTLKTNPDYYLYADSTSKTINIAHNLNDIDGALTYQYTRLYYAGELVAEYNDINKTTFDELLSNNCYRIEVGFLCDINNGEFEYVRSIEVYTQPLMTPYISIMVDMSTKTEISYNYDIYDPEDIVTSYKVYLKNSEGIIVNSNPTNNKFTNLLSNNYYYIVIEYECDLNDGFGTIVMQSEAMTQTLPLENPSFDLEFESTIDSITYQEVIIDNDNTVSFVSADIYLGEKLISTITDEKVFEGLKANTIYTIKYNYSYNMNDGQGNSLASYIEEYSTLAHEVIVTGYEILNDLAPKTNEDINIKFYIENLSAVQIDFVTINGEEREVVGGDGINDLIVIVDSGDVSGDISIEITQMKYLLNGFVASQNVNFDEEIIVTVLSRLNILNVSTIDGMSFYKLNNQFNNFVVKLDNPENYEIKSIKYYYNEWNHNDDIHDVYMIDNNHITFYVGDWYVEDRVLDIVEITYIDENGKEAVRKYNQSFEISAAGLYTEELTQSLVVHYISTPEEFMNMESGNAYELTNDLDMTGYVWKQRDFRGFFDGKGHTISNLTLISEDEYTDHRSVALFNSLDGIFRNIYFKNLFFNTQTLGTIQFNLLYNNGNPELTNILISGAASLTNNNGYSYYNPPVGDSIYIVDDFLINTVPMNYSNKISSSELTDEFKEETLGWVFVEKEYATYDDLLYYLIDDAYIFISKYMGTGESVIIPEYINGKPVIGISDLAFEDAKSLKSIELTDELIYIGGSILKGCSNLEAIYGFDSHISNLTYMFGKIEYENSYNVDGCGYIPRNLSKISIINNSEIYEHSFDGITSLKEVVIEYGVTNIGPNAFRNCKSLTSVVIPNSVSGIDHAAFFDCDSLTSVVIPNSVTSIGSEAFHNCNSLTSVVIPNSVTSIGSDAFIGCSGLTNIVLSDNIKNIEHQTFWGCDSLVSIVIPDGVTKISSGAFAACNSLKSIYIPKTVKRIDENNFTNSNNVIYYEGTEEEFNDIYVDKYNIPIVFCNISDVKYVNDGKYEYSLVNNEFIYSLQSLDKSITTFDFTKEFPDYKLISLGQRAFYEHNNLKEINLGNDIEFIAYEAFYYCHNIKCVYLPKSIKEISEGAFRNNANKTIYYQGSLEEFNNVTIFKDFDMNLIAKYNVDSISYINTEKYEYVLVNEEYIYNFKHLDNLIVKFNFETEFPDYKLISLGERAFYEHNNLKEINLGNDIEFIAYEAFYYCHNIKCVYLPKSIKEISEGAFRNNANKTIYYQGSLEEFNNVTIFKDFDMNLIAKYNVDSISYINTEKYEYVLVNEEYIYNFKHLDNLIVKFNFETEFPEYKLISLANDAFRSHDHLVEIELGSSLELIGNDAFNYCRDLDHINLPDTLKEIGDYAFVTCYDLKEVTLPDNISKVGKNIFSSVDIMSINVPRNLTVIPYDFLSIEIKNLYIPNTITEIKDNSFITENTNIYYEGTEDEWNNIIMSDNLKAIDFTIAYNVESYKKVKTTSEEYFLINGKDIYNFKQINTNILSFDFIELYPDYELKSLAIEAFRDCNNLRFINIPEGITKISESTFVNCNSLKAVKIPNSVNKLADKAFGWCYNLAEINIPKNVTSIGAYILSDISMLKYIYFEPVVVPTLSNEFLHRSTLENLTAVYVREEAYDSYAAIEDDLWQELVVSTNKLIGVNETELNILNGNISFNDQAVLYDGEAHSIQIEGDLPEGVSVTYTNNNQTETGSYTVKATFKKNGEIVAELEATLLIIGEDYISDNTNYTYTLDGNNKATITGYLGNDTIVCLPAIINDGDNSYEVIGISAYAFSNNSAIETVHILSNIETIGYEAFYNCMSLKTVIFYAKEASNIGSDIFGNTWNQEDFIIYIPNGSYDSYAAISDNYWQEHVVSTGKLHELAE